MKNQKRLRNVALVVGILGLLAIGILILISHLRPAAQNDTDETVQESPKIENEILGVEVLDDLDNFDVSTRCIRVRGFVGSVRTLPLSVC